MKPFKTASLLALAVGLGPLLASASGAQAQNAAPRDPMRADAAAQIDVPVQTGTAPVPPSDAPMSVPLKTTNYPVPEGAIFVAPNGKAANDGKTPDAPTTVQRAVETAPVGATIVFRGGIYRGVDNVRIAKKLTLQAYPNEKPWLWGSIPVQGFTRDDNAARVPVWRHDAWPHSFPFTWGREYLDPAYPMAGLLDMVWVGDKYLSQVGALDQMGPGQFFVDAQNKRLYLGDDPTGKTVEATAHRRAFTLQTVDKTALAAAPPHIQARAATFDTNSDPSGTQIRGLGFARYADFAGQMSAPGLVIEDCTFAWNGQLGLSLSMHVDQIRGVPPRGMIVRGNTFMCNGRTGFHASHIFGATVENNTFAYNNVERFRAAWDAAGLKIVYTPNLILRRNLAERNYATGLWLDISVDNAVVTHNLVRHNQGIGIFFEISRGAIIAYNIAHDNGAGIQISNASRARVWNNTLVNNNTAFFVQQWKRLNTDPWTIAGIRPGAQYLTRDNEFVNNLVAIIGKKVTWPLVVISGDGGGSSDKMSRMEGNRYFVGPGADVPAFARWAAEGTPEGPILTLADFQRETGLDVGAIDQSPAIFVDAANGDFRLAGGTLAEEGAALPLELTQVSKAEDALPTPNPELAGARWFPASVGAGIGAN